MLLTKLEVAVELDAEDQLAQVLFPERDLMQPDVDWILRNILVQVFTRTYTDIVVMRSSAGDRNIVIEKLDAPTSKYANVRTRFDPTPGTSLIVSHTSLMGLRISIITLCGTGAMIRLSSVSLWSYSN